MRVHGESSRYYHDAVGLNARLDTLQAAVLRVKLRHLDGWTAARQRNALAYDQAFVARGLSAPKGPIRLLAPARPGERHIIHQYVILAPKRDQLILHLAQKGVQTEVYYPQPMHLQECFAHLEYRAGQLPVSEMGARESLALPVHPELQDGAID